MVYFTYLLRLLLLALMFIGSSCEVFREWELEEDAQSLLVVEAILTDELISQEIKLSQSYSSFNGEAPSVSDAKVKVEAHGIVYDFLPVSLDSGLYKSEIAFSVFDHLTYTLMIEWEGETYTASSRLSEVAPLPTIAFKPFGNSDSLMTFKAFSQIYNVNQQSMYEVQIDWSHLHVGAPTQAKVYFYTFNSVHINELILPQRETVLFPRGSIVIAKKYGLNVDFAAYLRAMAIERDWNGNFFYAAPENLPTNISNDGLGFFSTCAVLLDTLIAQ